MSFAFSQIEPETTGQVLKMPTPVSDYLSASAEQGFHDAAFASIMRMREYSLEDDASSPMMDPEEASVKYGIPHHLSFDEPVRESVAQLMNSRKRAELDRQFTIENGSSAARFVPGLATSFLAGISNPLDFGSLFIPIVGEERLATQASVLGRGAFRQAIARGMVPFEAFERSRVPLPRFSSAVFQGMVYQSAAEVPTFLSLKQTGEAYSPNQFLTDVVAGGLFAGGLHASVSAAQRLWATLRPSTRDAMFKQAINDFLTDKESDLTRYANIDENTILQRVLLEHDGLLKLEAEKGINMDDVRRVVHEKYNEYPVAAAFLLDDGTHLKGDAHYLIDIPDDVKLAGEQPFTPIEKAEMRDTGIRWIADEGAVTNKGRFVSRDEMSQLLGERGPWVSEQMTSQTLMTPDEQAIYYEQMEMHGDKAEALAKVKEYRDIVRKNAFFARPEIQELVNRERDARIEQFMDQARRDFDPKQKFDEVTSAEIARQVQNGKVLSKQKIEQNTMSGESRDRQVVDDQVKSLQDELADKSSPERSSIVDQAIKKLDKVIEDLSKSPGMMLDPFLINTLGRPILRGAFIVAREMLRTGRSISDAVDMAMEYIKKRRQQPRQLSRRNFMDILGKSLAAAGIIPKLPLSGEVAPKSLLHLFGGSTLRDLARGVSDEASNIKHFMLPYNKIEELLRNKEVFPIIQSMFPDEKIRKSLAKNLADYERGGEGGYAMYVQDITPETMREIIAGKEHPILEKTRDQESMAYLGKLLSKAYPEYAHTDPSQIIAHMPISKLVETGVFTKGQIGELENLISELMKLKPDLANTIKLLHPEHRIVGPPELPPLPDDKHKLVTIERADGSTYQAAEAGKWEDLPGKPPVISRVVDGEWSTGSLHPGEKIVEEPKDLDTQIREALIKEIQSEAGADLISSSPENITFKITELEQTIPHPEAVDTALDCILRRIA